MLKMIFDIHEWVTAGSYDSWESKGVVEYIRANGLSVNEHQVMLSGRILRSELNVGDRLFTKDGSHILTVRMIHAYEKAWDSLETGMTCAVLADIAESCSDGPALHQFMKLYKSCKE